MKDYGGSISIDPKDPRNRFYFDSHDYRRPRPRGMVPSLPWITICIVGGIPNLRMLYPHWNLDPAAAESCFHF